MTRKIIIPAVFLTAFYLFSCTKENEPAAPPDQSYYPLNIGETRIYDVDSIVIDGNSSSHPKYSYHFCYKDSVESIFKDLSGREAYRIERYKQDTVTKAWYIIKVYYSNLTRTTAEVVFDDKRIVKLTFPAKKNAYWNGYDYAAVDYERFRYIYVDKSDSIGGKWYDKLARVQQVDYKNLIEYHYSYEVYAKDIGMVTQVMIKDSSDDTSPGIPFEERITGGVELTLTLKDYKK